MDSNQSPLADPVFYRTYSRRQESARETWSQATDRAIGGLIKLGKFTPAESDLLRDQCLRMRALPAGRWLWIGGTPWINKPENYPGAFNCHNSHLRPSPLENTGSPWEVMGYLMQLAMMGCGVGRVCSLAGAAEFPLISRSINVRIVGSFGDVPKPDRQDETTYAVLTDGPRITIGDSRQGWSDAYQSLLEIASGHHPIAHADQGQPIEVAVDISHVRPCGERLAGFGGVANPIKLPDLFGRVAKILNHAIGRKLTPLELALISDEAALVVVAGNVRRCLPADALVHTVNGLVPIEDVQVGDMVHTPIGLRRVTVKFDQGVQDVYTIEVAGDAQNPRATLNHRMAVADESVGYRWVEVGKLAMGDCLLTPESKLVLVIGVGGAIKAQTYDIEVEKAHCFYADGYLTHNSAGMVQLDSEDTLPVDWLGVNAQTAKHGLWIQRDDESWAIDPNRDALRMSNHTKVFMRRPTEQECVESVRSQYYSGEGAIQYAPEEIARANRDLLDTPEKRQGFFRAIEIGPQSAKQYLLSLMPPLGTDDFEAQRQRDQELDHRVDRYGLNPCFAAGTMILTRDGHHPIELLVGKTVEVFDGEQWVEIDNFRVTGRDQPMLRIELHSGQSIRVTPYHQFVLIDGTRKEAKDLVAGDRLLWHTEQVNGSHHESAAYLKGFLVADGTTMSGRAALWLYKPKWVCQSRIENDLQELSESRSPVCVKVKFKQHGTDRRDIQLGATHPSLNPWCSSYRHGLPIAQMLNWDEASKLNFLAGYFDGDGSAADTSNGFMYQCTSISRQLLLDVQVLLQSIGVHSKLSLNKAGGAKDFGPNRGGVYNTRPLWRLTISQRSSVAFAQKASFTRLTSFADKKISYQVSVRSFNVTSVTPDGIDAEVYCCTVPTNHQVALSNGLITGQCGEATGNDFFCNLSTVCLNQQDPIDLDGQVKSFRAAGLYVSALLQQGFDRPRYQYSREIDPIVLVSFTGGFDFFVKALGVDWLRWWEAGRPDWWVGTDLTIAQPIADRLGLNLESYRILDWDEADREISTDDFQFGDFYRDAEEAYLKLWRSTVEQTIWEYCDRHGLRRPNRCTGLKPEGTLSLLTGASPGWHPPKAARFIRRITFAKDDPIALACLDYGYSIVPAQSDKDEDGNLLNDPFDPRCTEWLVEIPVAVSWAGLPGADTIAIEKFSALAQFDFWMQVQKHYTTHSTSATIELRESEIEPLGQRIYQAIQEEEGYISTALLSRFDDLQTFPRLPFEPISRETYLELQSAVESRRKPGTFAEHLARHDRGDRVLASEQGPAGCDSDKCLLPERK